MRPFTLLRLRSPGFKGSLAWLHEIPGWVDVMDWDDCRELLKTNHQPIPLLWMERQELTDEDFVQLRDVRKLWPQLHIILCMLEIPLEKWLDLQSRRLFWHMGSTRTPVHAWKFAISSALDDYAAQMRQRHRLSASRERNARLIRLTQNLELQVQKKTKKLVLSTRKLAEHEHQLERIKSLLVQLNASNHIREIFGSLARQLSHLVPCTELSIVMRDWSGRGLVAIKGTAGGDTVTETLKTAGEKVIERCFNGLEPVVFRRGASLTELVDTGAFVLRNHASVLFLPLSIGSNPGVILVASHDLEAFSTDVIATLRHLQPPLSVALERVFTLGALKLLQHQWEATFDAIRYPLFILSENGTITRTNAAADQVLAEVPDMADLVRSEKKSGTLRSAGREFEAIPMPFDHKGKALTLLHLREVTEEKDLLQQLLQSEKLASVGLLSEKVAHELNNPLAGIMALSQVLQSEFDGAVLDDLKEIEKACRRCKHIIENLVEFSRTGSPDASSEISFNEVVEDTLTLARAALTGVTLQTTFDRSIPVIRGHFQKLQQVIFNLIQNACQSMQGKGTLKLETATDPVAKSVIFRIRDSGEGIPEEHFKQIFTPFFTTKRAGVGTGLGLSICRKIVEEHAGSIRLTWSEPKKGTEFELAFPA